MIRIRRNCTDPKGSESAIASGCATLFCTVARCIIPLFIITLLIQFRQLSLGLPDTSLGFESLVEKCCRKGLAEFAQVILQHLLWIELCMKNSLALFENEVLIDIWQINPFIICRFVFKILLQTNLEGIE